MATPIIRMRVSNEINSVNFVWIRFLIHDLEIFELGANSDQSTVSYEEWKLESTFLILIAETKKILLVPGWTSLDNFGLAGI